MEEKLRADLMSRLSQHKSLGAAPPAEHQWLVEHGTLRTYNEGDVVTPRGQKAKNLIILLSGDIVIRTDAAAGGQKIVEWKGGDVGGMMPYSRGASPPSDSVAEEVTEALTVSADILPDMIRECPAVTAALVHAMVDRARQFTSSDLRNEKLISLGKLAAGLAHELNNPASAVIRSAKALNQSLTAAEHAARQLSAADLTDEQFACIENARTMCTASSLTPLSSVARADREDAITSWLADHDANEDAALQLADTGVTLESLDTLASNVNGKALDASLQWIASCCAVRSLSSEIETAASRIYDLVGAVKGFSFMDHAPTPEPVDIRRGIADTFTMLGAKTRGKSVNVSVDLPEDLPRVQAIGAELNQVWMNLIENALDAVPQGGNVSVTAEQKGDTIVVSVIDDGPGIPAEIQQRIYDPFFTTKGVGKGTGLGLDTVKRLLKRHEGGIDLDSKPGRTEFQVRLPAENKSL